MKQPTTTPASTNVVWHNATVTRTRREAQNAHRGTIIWFTGLSGAGKSTLAHAVEETLHQRGCRTFVLDGDNVRHGLCGDLGFSPEARVENIRRVGEVAMLFMEAGIIVLTAFISPYREDACATWWAMGISSRCIATVLLKCVRHGTQKGYTKRPVPGRSASSLAFRPPMRFRKIPS